MKKPQKTELTNASPENQHKDIPGNPSTAKSSTVNLRSTANASELRVLTKEQWVHWKARGYVVIKNAVTEKQAEDTARLLWEFEGKDPNDQSTWYTPPRAEMKMKELAGTGMVEIYNHQLLWNNRQTQKVYESFVDVWGIEKLWVTIDRANLNFPIKTGYEYNGFIHWDYDPATKPQNVQGVLALSDQMDEKIGGFQCIPWLYQHFDEWLEDQPDDRDPYKPNLEGLEDKIVKMGMEAGDLLIFNSLLPHGIRPNLTKDKVRVAQYISMMPAEENNQALKEWRIYSWRNRIAPKGYAFPGDPRKWEQKKYGTAELNELGKKLLGLEKW